MLYVYLTLFAAAVAALDQWTKALAAAQLTGRTVVLIPGWLQLHYITNDGMALSLLSGKRWFFVVVAAVYIAFVVWAVAKNTSARSRSCGCWRPSRAARSAI